MSLQSTDYYHQCANIVPTQSLSIDSVYWKILGKYKLPKFTHEEVGNIETKTIKTKTMKQKPISILFKIFQSRENGEKLLSYHKSDIKT